MLMIPIRPKVMARPMATTSRTEPSEMPRKAVPMALMAKMWAMKLIRFGDEGTRGARGIAGGRPQVDASGEFHDYDEGFFASGGLEALAEWVADGCPWVARWWTRGCGWDRRSNRPSKLVCVGKNYLDHAKELGEGIPTEPALVHEGDQRVERALRRCDDSRAVRESSTTRWSWRW
jgi:hypothetical protein